MTDAFCISCISCPSRVMQVTLKSLINANYTCMSISWVPAHVF